MTDKEKVAKAIGILLSIIEDELHSSTLSEIIDKLMEYHSSLE